MLLGRPDISPQPLGVARRALPGGDVAHRPEKLYVQQKPAQMPAALAALESAIAAEEAAIQAAKNAKKEEEYGNPAALDAVPLRQRALPFMELLKNSHKADVEIVWGV